ncbi:3-deoxy-7-phosphoheptulonate synthase [Pseudomonas sp. RIT-PI-S]|uniref:3-deoxy-7-phosphoheptulonate synthase n=1 Tax=Pseudomonas sp. RIT-PI-S TaxID=3035295 RepID=UPI0021D7D501|nr:3-deoxy-7-phosphoheptulonate synthase [Pseudomonas sp. RIT-PI-S]
MNTLVTPCLTASTPALPLAAAQQHGVGQRLPTAFELRQALPRIDRLHAQVEDHREQIRDILCGRDERLLVVAGPCSLHDPKAALEYGARLARLADALQDQLLIVMRAYVEKPRTTVGWKGLLYDPRLDGSDDMLQGLALSRELMLGLLNLGLPLAGELLQPMAVTYFEDLLAWGAVGARTTESQIHREMASGLRLPVGFKNGTDGSLGVACDAIRSAAHPHRHFGLDLHGHPCLLRTDGNPDCHLVLRGGHGRPNYSEADVASAAAQLRKAGVSPRIMVDCSHANSGKDPLRQPEVLAEVLRQRRQGSRELFGVMLESHLFEGAQSLGPELRYGVSITDACLGWEATEATLRAACA